LRSVCPVLQHLEVLKAGDRIQTSIPLWMTMDAVTHVPLQGLIAGLTILSCVASLVRFARLIWTECAVVMIDEHLELFEGRPD